jgi:hypothetical protein
MQQHIAVKLAWEGSRFGDRLYAASRPFFAAHRVGSKMLTFVPLMVSSVRSPTITVCERTL